MKITCKCGEVLTKDLRPTKYWKIDHDLHEAATEPYEYSDGTISEVYEVSNGITYYEPRWRDYEVRPGTFIRDKKYDQHWHLKSKYIDSLMISGHDYLNQKVLEYRRGCGCCAPSGDEVFCPSCETVIGTMYLDCYEEKHIALIVKKIQRKY